MKQLVIMLLGYYEIPWVKAALKVVYDYLTRYKYISDREIVYTCPRTRRTITVPIGMPSDGATFAWDIENTDSWWIHDRACDAGKWDGEGGPITALEAAQVLGTILWKEGRKIRAVYWGVGTFVFGCDKAKANGWW